MFKCTIKQGSLICMASAQTLSECDTDLSKAPIYMVMYCVESYLIMYNRFDNRWIRLPLELVRKNIKRKTWIIMKPERY